MLGKSVTRRYFLGAGAACLGGALAARAQSSSDPNNQVPTNMRIRMTFDGRTMTATLYDNPAARDFYAMLPLDLKIENFSNNEKIAYLPRKLTEVDSGPFSNERPYDLCYYKPWGNLAMFYDAYKHPGLIRLGRFDAGFEALHVPGSFPLRIERL